MNPPFLLLLAAAGLFRFLAADANKTFHRRLTRLLPRKVLRNHLEMLLDQYTDRLAEFRRRVLPFSAVRIAFDTAACACFACALWFFPPAGMEQWDLFFVRYGSLLLVPVAFIVDLIALTRLFKATFRRDVEPDGAV